MQFSDVIPWSELAVILRKKAEHNSGVKGAVVGASLGAVVAIVATRNRISKLTLEQLIAGSVIGLAYGIADEESISKFRAFFSECSSLALASDQGGNDDGNG